MSRPFTLIAHRCGTDRYPELTAASARHLLAAGAAYVEMDIRFTADGAPVVNHDETCAFLFGDERRVSAVTLAEFRAMRHRSDCTFSACTMADFLAAGIRRIVYHVKEGGARLPEILGVIRRYGAENEIVLGLQTVEDVRYVRRNSTAQILAFLPNPDQTAAFAGAGADIIRLWEGNLTPENIQAVHQTGKRLWVMAKGAGQDVGETDLNRLKTWRDDFGADGVLINRVLPAVRALT